MAGLPSLGLAPSSLSSYVSLAYPQPFPLPAVSGFALDAVFYTPQYPEGSVRMIEFRPTGEVTFYTIEDKPHSCFYSGVIKDNANVQVILHDSHHDEKNRCENIIQEYGRHFFDKGIRLDLQKMQTKIAGEHYGGAVDIYNHGKSREEPGYCVALTENGMMDCTFEGKTGQISFHLDGGVDIFNNEDEQVSCKYSVRSLVVTISDCGKTTDSFQQLIDFIGEDNSLSLHPLTLTVRRENEYAYQSDEYVYKQVQWEEVFFDANGVRVRGGVRMDCDFAADDDKHGDGIHTISFKRNGMIEVTGNRNTYSGDYEATFNAQSGKITVNVPNLKSQGYGLQSLRSGENSLMSMSLVIKNKAMRRMEIDLHGGPRAVSFTSGGDCRAFKVS